MPPMPRPGVSTRPMVARTASRDIDCHDAWAELEERIELVPEAAEIRGMFLRELVHSAGLTVSRMYIPFSLYSVREYMALILRAARASHPQALPADAVLRTGWDVYSVFSKSLAGSAVFAMAGDFRRAVELAPKAYNLTLKPGTIDVRSLTSNSAYVEIRKVWAFPDIFHAGIWLGGMEAFGVSGEIAVTRRSSCDVDFELSWVAKNA
jgi:uncharacterized protein (TIGR02265 family)